LCSGHVYAPAVGSFDPDARLDLVLTERETIDFRKT
jgi:hypothetical protein